MGRLFITPREIDFINDVTKELIKDVIGERIYLYPVSYVKSKVHELYGEAPDKVFENPIIIEALVNYQPEEVRGNSFGLETYHSIEVYIQTKDLDDKGITLREGDFFTYGAFLFEVIGLIFDPPIFGQIEHDNGVKVIGKEARKTQFFTKVFGPLGEEFGSDPRAVMTTFEQQRGFEVTGEGPTGDIRDLQEKQVLEKPLTGPAKIGPNKPTTGNPTSSFYDE